MLGANKREDGYLVGNGYIVSWCVGHLMELAQPEAYDEKYSKWAYADLPIFPADWRYEVSVGTKKQFAILKKLMTRDDVASLVCATDAGRKSELIFRLVYHKAGCRESHLSDFGFLPWKIPLSGRALKISGLELNMMLCMKQPYVESEPTGLLALTLLDFFLPFTGRL